MRVTSENWLEAQYSVLGAALIDERVVPKVMSETSEDDFSSGCKTVYQAMRKLFDSNSPVDVQSVNHALGEGHTQFLLQLMEIVPTGANVDHHIALCKEQAKLLALQGVAQDLVQADTMDAAREAVEKANGLLADRKRGNIVDMAQSMRSFMDRKTKKVQYLTWPIGVFNNYLFSGCGDFIILGAEPSVGKTAFALQCAWHWADAYKVGFFSLETSPEKLFDRMMASVSGLHMSSIKNSELSDSDWGKVAVASQQVVSRKLDLIPASGYTTADIRAKILENKYQIVIIDYLQLVSARGSNRYEQVTNVSIDLHNIAQGLDVTVLALSQLSRSDDDRTPKNSDLRESGQLEQDADVIMMLHLEKKSNPSGNRKLTVTKNKEGECFQTVLAFDGKHQTFTKAQRTGDVVGKYVADGKKARTKNKKASEEYQQFSILPDDGYKVPF